MKVNINNEQLEIYDTDDNSIVKRSIAKALNTLPKYLFFKTKYNKNAENEIIDIKSVLKTFSSRYVITIKEFLKDRKKYDIDVNSLEEIDIIRDIIYVILYYNKELSDTISEKDKQNKNILLLEFYTSTYKTILELIFQIDDSLDKQKVSNNTFFNTFINEEYEIVKKSLEQEKKKNLTILNEYIKLEEEIRLINLEDSQITEFKTEERYTDISYKTDFNLIEIFDRIKLSEKAVYCNFNDFHKIYNNFTPPTEESWIQSSENIIRLKVNNKTLVSDINDHRKYKTIEIFKISEDTITIRFEYLQNDSTIDYEKFMNLIFKTLDLKYDISLIEELVRNIKGYFYMKNDDFDFVDFIFADMTMNNPLFKRISINEREKTTKDKVEIPIKFFHYTLGYVTCNLNKEIKLDNTDSYLSECLKVSNIDIPLNTQYIKFHVIKARNEEAVKEFKNYINTMLVIYKRELENYKNEYDEHYGENYVNKYINLYFIKKLNKLEFSNNETEEVIKGSEITDIERIIKRSREKYAYVNFNTLLEYISKKYKLTLKILDRLKDYNKQITEYDKSKGVIRFNCNKQVKVKDYIDFRDNVKVEQYKDFVNDEGTIKFKLNEEQSFIISCDHHDKDKTIIWKDNPFPSKRDIPVLPCCSKTGQKKKKRDIEKDVFTYKNIIETNKICSIRQLGVLPDNINSLFNIISPGSSFYRTGSIRTKESLLYCILSVLYTNTTKEDVEYSKNKLASYIKKGKLRNGLVKQECYDMNNEQILSYFTENKYMDPNILYRFLEENYKCNIITFTDGEDKNGCISIPRHAKNHLRFNYNKDRPFIFIYENNGTQFPMLEYPQCELIVLGKRISKTQKEQDVINSFKSDEYDFIDKLMEFYNKINTSYYLTDSVKSFVSPIVEKENEKGKSVYCFVNKKFEITSQSINSFGKTFLFYVSDSDTGNEFQIFTEPIPPINVKIKRYETYKSVSYEYMKSIILSVKGSISGKVVYKNKCIEVLFNVNNIKCSLRIEDIDERILKNVYTKNKDSIINILKLDSDTGSDIETIDNFVTNKKLARNLNEFIIYLFSYYLNENGIDNGINNTHIENFLSERIILDKNTKLELSDFDSLNFEKYSNLLINGKLSIPSEDLKNKIRFSLEFILRRDVNKLINYHTKTRMDNFFINLSDFTIIPGQITLYKEQSVINYINDKLYKSKDVISDSVILNRVEPYFFSNKIFNNVIFLAQRVDTIQKASYVLYNWYKNGVNKGSELYTDKNDYNEKNDYSTTLEKNVLVYSYINTFDIKIIAKVNDKNELYNSFILAYKYDNDKIDYLCLLEIKTVL